MVLAAACFSGPLEVIPVETPGSEPEAAAYRWLCFATPTEAPMHFKDDHNQTYGNHGLATVALF